MLIYILSDIQFSPHNILQEWLHAYNFFTLNLKKRQ